MTKEMRLSPSSINTYFRCPRLFYYNYKKKIRSPFNIHLYKGNFVHKALEDLFDATKAIDVHDFVNDRMYSWNAPKYLFENEEEAKYHKDDAKNILERFATRFQQKMDMVLSEGKVNGPHHAWNMIKPSLREQKLKDEELNMVGIIDAIESNFDDEVYVIDYKTSKLYKNTMSSEYIRQLKIYAYLYLKEYGKLPDYVGVHYLRYGEVFMIPIELVEGSVVDSVKEDVAFVRKNIVSENIDDYPKCDNDWCDCHDIEKKLKLDEESIDLE